MKILRFVAVFVVIAILTCCFVGCHDSEKPTTSDAAPEISDDIPTSEDWVIAVGESRVWIPFDEAEEDVIFRNHDIRYVELRAGKSTAEIVGVAEGESTLTADWGDKHYRIHVVVKEESEESVVVSEVSTETPAATEAPKKKDKKDNSIVVSEVSTENGVTVVYDAHDEEPLGETPAA